MASGFTAEASYYTSQFTYATVTSSPAAMRAPALLSPRALANGTSLRSALGLGNGNGHGCNPFAICFSDPSSPTGCILTGVDAQCYPIGPFPCGGCICSPLQERGPGGTCVCLPANLCGGACVDKQTNNFNCGSCGNRCAVGTACSGGMCINITSDPNNCGAPGQRCVAPDSTCCNGVCVDVNTDPNNCGQCGNVVNITNDPFNCGSCGNVCPSGLCCNGVCCPPDLGCCGGISCGRPCPDSTTCCLPGSTCNASSTACCAGTLCPDGKTCCGGAFPTCINYPFFGWGCI
jgi:hypothetical protein